MIFEYGMLNRDEKLDNYKFNHIDLKEDEKFIYTELKALNILGEKGWKFIFKEEGKIFLMKKDV